RTSLRHSLAGIAAPPPCPHHRSHTTTSIERGTTMFDVREMADRYVSIWNEPAPEARRKLVHDLWSEDAVHIVETPDEMRERAHELGFPAPRLVVHGHEEIERRTAQD